MSGASTCRVVWVGGRGRGGRGFGGYQPGVYVPLKALFLVNCSSTLFLKRANALSSMDILRFGPLRKITNMYMLCAKYAREHIGSVAKVCSVVNS